MPNPRIRRKFKLGFNSNPSSLEKRFHLNYFTFVRHSAWICLPLRHLNYSLKSVCAPFFTSRFVIDRFRIVSDILWQKIVSQFVFKQVKVPLLLRKLKCCFGSRLLKFLLPLLAGNLSVSCRNSSPNLVGFFGNIALRCRKKKKCHSPA